MPPDLFPFVAPSAAHALVNFIEQAPAPFCVLGGPDLVYELLNPAYQQLFPGRELLGRPILEALPELQSQPIAAALRHVYATGSGIENQQMRVSLTRTPGGPVEERYFDTTYRPRRDEAGQVTGIWVFAYEVTEQVRAHQRSKVLNQELEARVALRTQELSYLNRELEARVAARTQELAQAQATAEAQRQRLAEFFQQAPAPICVLDGPDFVYELVNPGYQQFFPGRPLLGLPLLEALPELAEQAVPELLRQVYTTGVSFEGRELLVPMARTPSSPVEDRYFNFVYQARRTTGGQIDSILVFAHEVTEQVLARQQVQRLNEALAATNQQLRHTNTDLDTFVYTASHDLKAPIANIEGLLLALREQLPPDALTHPLVPRLLAMMDQAVTRFQQTIGHLTEISQLQQAEPPVALDLVTLVEDVRLDLEPLLLATEARLTVDVAACATVQCPPKTLRSVVYNLLSNAVKYRAPDRPPVVALHCQAVAGQVILTVQDNGLGLDEQQLSRLFGMFRRLHTHVEGSGVGLFMVKRLIENAGGTITVQSAIGIGSTFTVSFPV